MAQALKIIQFETEENNEKIESSKNNINQKNFFSSVSKPLKYAAAITAILGVISLILEIKLYFLFSYELYLARLFPTVFSFLTLILVNSSFGKKHRVALVHFYLISLITSISFFVFKVPQFFTYNLFGTLLLVLVLSHYFLWKTRNQIIVTAYFSAAFLTSSIASGIFSVNEINTWVFTSGVIALLLVSILASNLKYKSNLEGLRGYKNLFDEMNSEAEPNGANNYYFSEFFERSIVPFFQLSFEGKLKYCNPAFTETLKTLGDNEVSNFNFFTNFVKNEKVKTHILKKLESKGRIENYRLNIIGKDGNEEIYLMDCKVESTDSEKPNLEGSIKNITLQFNKEKELNPFGNKLGIKRNSARVLQNISDEQIKKPNLISKLGHELRTPMNSVLGFLTLIENGLFETEDELKDFSRSAKISAESLLNLLNDIVELSKIDDGSIDVTNDEFNIRAEIDKVVSIIDPHIKEKKLHFEYSISDEVPDLIISDQFKYNQILTNLITNAIQATDEGEIKLLVSLKELSKQKYEIITTVLDTSNGIEKNQLDELLNNDLISGSHKSKVTTSVLHVMICKKLLQLLNGSLEAKSEIGKGSKFSFSIFYDTNNNLEEIETVSKVVDKPEIFAQNSKPRLLLVEDNPISQKVEKKLLEDAGYNVDCVDNGFDAIEKISTGVYNLALMDIELKDLNGLETTKKIRELSDEVSQIPIVAVTAQSSMKDREKCLLAGMNDYISKPINITFLKMTIDQWLNAAKAK